MDSTPRSFFWETAFPEPGLSREIRAIYSHSYPDEVTRNRPDKFLLLATIIAVREAFHHFGVPDTAVDSRFAQLNMACIWAEMEPFFDPEILNEVPIRDPADRRCAWDPMRETNEY